MSLANGSHLLVRSLRKSLRTAPTAPVWLAKPANNDQPVEILRQTGAERDDPSAVVPCTIQPPLAAIVAAPVLTSTVPAAVAAPAARVAPEPAPTTPLPPVAAPPAWVAPAADAPPPRSTLGFAAGLLCGVVMASLAWIVVKEPRLLTPFLDEAPPAVVTASPAQPKAAAPVPSPPPAPPEPTVATTSVKTDPAPPPPTPPSASPAAAPLDYPSWKQQRIAAIEKTFPELHAWHNTVMGGEWRETGKIVAGSHPSLPLGSPEHLALLQWLVLDPPKDADTRRAVHNLFTRLTPSADCLTLWEPLVQNRAMNAPDIRAAAEVLLTLRERSLDERQKQRLQTLISSAALPTNR